mgnify:CR=1 FL=1
MSLEDSLDEELGIFEAEPTMAEELETVLDSVDDLEDVGEKLVSNG